MARCGCSSAGSCACSIVGDGVTVKGTGDPGNPYVLGLDVKTASSDCIGLTGAGTKDKPLKAVPILSPEPDNQLICTPKGLYVPPRNEESDPEPPEDVVQAAGLMGANRFNVKTGTWTRVIGLRPDPRFPTSGTALTNSGAILRAVEAGYYQVSGTIQFLGEGGEGRRGLAFDTSADPGAPLNTTTMTYANFGAVDGPDRDIYLGGSVPMFAPAGHYLRMWIYQDSGATFRASGNNFTWVRAVKQK